jgi:hypothetical protein
VPFDQFLERTPVALPGGCHQFLVPGIRQPAFPAFL